MFILLLIKPTFIQHSNFVMFTGIDEYKNIFLCACLLILPFLLLSQNKTIDSLLLALQNARHDTAKINLNYKLAEQLNGYDAAAAHTYLATGYTLAKSGNDKFYIAKYYLTKGHLLFSMAKYDEALLSLDSSIALYDQLLTAFKTASKQLDSYKFDKADCLTTKGLILARRYNYQESIQNYLKAIAGIEDIKGKAKNDYMARLYANISSNYYELEQFENALKYDKQGLLFVNRDINADMYVIANLFVADDFNGLSQYDSSAVYLEKVRSIVIQLDKPNLKLRFYYILGGIYRKQKEWNKALASYQKANDAARMTSDFFQMANSEEGIAASYLHTGNLTKARELAFHVLRESDRMNVPFFKVQALQLLTEIEEKAGNIGKAFQYQKQFIAIGDSVKKEKMQRQMNETEVRYQTEKKEKEIIQLQKNNALQSLSLQKKSTFNYFLIGSVAALLITGFLGYRNLRNRQQLAKQRDELQQQRIRELEKDRQLIAVDSLLKGQEEERSRLAKDLHDGLGGLLSGVKFSLSNMKDNLIVTPDNMAVFERSLDMLDTSIKELRRVAHNMMPEMLTKFGLDEALKEYCNTINATKLLEVKYQSLGMETRLDSSTEIIVYRIVQELLNNIFKHAMAPQAFIQLIRENDRLSIVVEDDGKGFDTAILEKSKGAGWANIRSRVEYLKGRLDIHSEPGKGTLVNMEFNV